MASRYGSRLNINLKENEMDTKIDAKKENGVNVDTILIVIGMVMITAFWIFGRFCFFVHF